MELLNPKLWLAYIVSVVLALSVGFGGGYYTKSKFVKADQVTQIKVDQKQTAQNVVESEKKSQTLETNVTASNDNVTKIEQAIEKRPKLVKPKITHAKPAQTAVTTPIQKPKQEITNEKDTTVPQPVQTVVSCDSYQLDIGTVRLLNAARQGVGLDTVTSSDETSDAASGITVEKFIKNDLEIVKLYLDLAKRHNELVDEVEAKLKEQAE